jgi:hypothetical protein
MDAGLLSDVIKHTPIMQQPQCGKLLTEAWEHKALVASGRPGCRDRYVQPWSNKVQYTCKYARRVLLGMQTHILQSYDATVADTVVLCLLLSSSVLCGVGSARIRPRRRSCSFANHTLLMEHSDAVSALAIVSGKLVSGSWDTTLKASSASFCKK